jgi:hypothetical protein
MHEKEHGVWWKLLTRAARGGDASGTQFFDPPRSRMVVDRRTEQDDLDSPIAFAR